MNGTVYRFQSRSRLKTSTVKGRAVEVFHKRPVRIVNDPAVFPEADPVDFFQRLSRRKLGDGVVEFLPGDEVYRPEAFRLSSGRTVTCGPTRAILALQWSLIISASFRSF